MNIRLTLTTLLYDAHDDSALKTITHTFPLLLKGPVKPD